MTPLVAMLLYPPMIPLSSIHSSTLSSILSHPLSSTTITASHSFSLPLPFPLPRSEPERAFFRARIQLDATATDRPRGETGSADDVDGGGVND